MKTEIREIITDIKAATLIGLEDSLWASLDTLLALPQVSGNPKIEDPFIKQAILPIGETLAESSLSIQQIQPIGKTSYAAFRGICVIALTIRLFTQEEGNIQELDGFGNDPRLDVRQSLSIAAEKYGEYNPRKLVEFTEHYFNMNLARSYEIVIRLLPTLLLVHQEKAFDYLSRIPFSNDNDLRLAFANTISQIAELGFEEQILEFMNELTNLKEDYLWPITKSLSGAWAAKQTDSTLKLLEKLSISYGPHKLISNALKALIRHGEREEVDNKLSDWKSGQIENLQQTAKQFNAKK